MYRLPPPNGPLHDPVRHPGRTGRAARVVGVRVCQVDGAFAELTVTAERAGQRSARTMSAPADTIHHAALALARHYDLTRQDEGAWVEEPPGGEPTNDPTARP